MSLFRMVNNPMEIHMKNVLNTRNVIAELRKPARAERAMASVQFGDYMLPMACYAPTVKVTAIIRNKTYIEVSFTY